MKYFKLLYLFVLISVMVLFTSASGQRLKPEELIQKHLDAIAPAEKRAEAESYIAVADIKITNVTRRSPPTIGRAVFASAGSKSFLGMNLNSNDNPVEKITFDGGRPRIDFTIPGQRSVFGNLLQANPFMIQEGLLGGTLSTNWALFGVEEKRPKLSTSGTRKVNGVDSYVLRYVPRGGADFEVTLYFAKDTFNHIRTEYRRTASASIGRNIDESARQSETRIRITEDFSDHKEFEGIKLPAKYTMLYSISGQNGTTEISWEYELIEFALNPKLDDDTFNSEQ